ncbi:MAG: ester cyclase [Gammaproteobacteria bacterium]|nr:ester cyclase [Gammaproteobacteria bacterium]
MTVPISMIAVIHQANAALLEQGQLDAVEQFFTPDYVAHITGRDMKGGHKGIREVVSLIRSAFPELRVEVEILVEGEIRVAWQRTFRAIQQGAYRGFPACGKEIIWRDMVTSQFQDGKIAEEWVVTDLAERLLLARKQ